MNARHEKILLFLKNSNTWVRGKDLSTLLMVSDRTIRSDIEKLNQEFPGLIESSTRNGYQLNEEHYQTFKGQQDSMTPQTPDERAVYIIKNLLFNDKKLNFSQIQDDLYISENTLEGDIKRVRAIVKPYEGLSLVRENRMLSFGGDERIKRKIYRDLLTNESRGNFLNIDKTASLYEKFDLLYATEILKNILKENDYEVRQTAMPMIIVHIGISIERMLNGNYIEASEQSKDIRKTQEYELSHLFYERITKSIQIEYRESEVEGLAAILMGYKNSYLLKASVQVKGVKHQIAPVIDKIIILLKETFDLDFSQDEDFRNGLHLHIQSLIKRIALNNSIPNVHLQEIKRTFPLIFEMGIATGRLIATEMEVYISEIEAGFLALHIGAAYERTAHKEKYHVMLIAPSNESLAKLTRGKITNMFKERLVITHISEYFSESDVELSNVDLIITTMPIEHNLSVQTIQVSLFLNHEDESKIFMALNELDKRRFDIEFKTRFGTLIDERFFYTDLEGQTDFEIIEFMSGELEKNHIVDRGFTQSVIDRERISSTSFVYSVAIPHALELVSNHSKISIAILKNPIKWGSYEVKLVLLLAISEEDSALMWSFFDWLSGIIDNTEKLSRLMKSKNRNEFVHWIMND